MTSETLRDHFAAAALTGLLYPEVDDEFAMPYIVGRAYLWADAMLRERCREGGDCPGQGNAANLDAVPAVKAGTPGTGDTPKPIKGDVSDRSKPIASEQEPVAWGVADGKGLLATSIHRIDAVDMQSDYAYHTEIVPLYRQPPCQDISQKNLTLTDAEREAVERAVDSIASIMPYESQQGLADWKTLRGLLRRMGGGR